LGDDICGVDKRSYILTNINGKDLKIIYYLIEPNVTETNLTEPN
jgi:hypothetical protein